MRSFRVIAMSALLVTSVASTALGSSYMPAMAGKGEPQGLRWKDRIVKIAVSRSVIEPNTNIKTGSDVIGAITRSLEAWEKAADISIQFELTDRLNVSPSVNASGASLNSGDGVSLITIAQSPENVLLFSKDPQAESAKTRVFFNRKPDFITEADIVLNPFQQFSTDGTFGTFDLESTLTHEIGHLLGLRHSGVLGATMSNSLPKNGTFGLADFTGRTLAESDVAAIRDLYGVTKDNDECCAVIVGKLNSGSVKPLKGVKIWAEEGNTGRVVALTDVAADGVFKLGGLSGGAYSLFWQKEARDGDASFSPVNLLGTYRVAADETRVLNEKIALEASDVLLNFVGINNQLTDSAVSLGAGREYTVYLGGKNLDNRKLEIEFNSPFITVDQRSIMSQDFGTDISVISFVVTVHAGTPLGVYSIFATGEDGTMSSLVGALNIQ